MGKPGYCVKGGWREEVDLAKGRAWDVRLRYSCRYREIRNAATWAAVSPIAPQALIAFEIDCRAAKTEHVRVVAMR